MASEVTSEELDKLRATKVVHAVEWGMRLEQIATTADALAMGLKPVGEPYIANLGCSSLSVKDPSQHPLYLTPRNFYKPIPSDATAFVSSTDHRGYTDYHVTGEDTTYVPVQFYKR